MPPERLHEEALRFVTAASQAEAAGRILAHLSEKEADIYRRGRNAKAHVPKSATPAQYRSATGLECVFGYLHLLNEGERARELFELAFGAM